MAVRAIRRDRRIGMRIWVGVEVEIFSDVLDNICIIICDLVLILTYGKCIENIRWTHRIGVTTYFLVY